MEKGQFYYKLLCMFVWFWGCSRDVGWVVCAVLLPIFRLKIDEFFFDHSWELSTSTHSTREKTEKLNGQYEIR